MRIRWLPVFVALAFAAPAFDVAARGRSPGKPSAVAKSKRSAQAKPSAREGRGKHVRGKHGRGKRHAPPPPTVQGEGADTPLGADVARPRSIPARAYAADGQSFYLNGEKIHVRGVPLVGPEGSELAKQRLQKALDAGEITLSEQARDEHGDTSAVVRVNGRDIADLLLIDELRSATPP